MLPGIIAARLIFSKLGERVAVANGRRAPVIRHDIRAATTGQKPTNFRRQKPANLYGRRKFSQDAKTATTASQVNPSEHWVPIYRFKHIQLAAAISRMKIYTTILVVAIVPVGILAYAKESIDFTTMSIMVGTGIFSLVALYVVSGFFRRLIGVISVNAEDTVRLGYLTFWGRRRNALVPLEDLLPLNELQNVDRSLKRQPYITIRRYSDEKFRLHLPMWKCEIVDQEMFERIFGTVIDNTKKEK